MTTNVFKSKIAKAGLGLLVAVGLIAGASTASAITQTEATTIITALGLTGAQAAAIQALVTTTGTSGLGTCYQFTSQLAVGTTSTQVQELQMVLNSNPATALAVAAGANGSSGHETTYFGSATASAVVKFQQLNGISPTAPQVGPQTRAALNAMCSTTGTGTGTGTGTTTPSTGVTAMLSTDNPAAGNVLTGQATADLLHVTFTGSGTVTQLSLQRTGISDNSVFPNVYLYQGNTRLTDSASVNGSGQIVFNNVNIAVNGSTTVSVRADIVNSSTNESTAGVTVTGYTVNGVTQAANIAGNQMNINNGTGLLATASIGTNSVAAANVSAGTSNYSLFSAPLNISLHTVYLKQANFEFIGSAPSNAFSGLGLYINGTQVATSTGIGANGYISFDLSSQPYLLNTGTSTLEVRGNIVNGSARTAQLALETASDLMLTDSQLNVNVAVNNQNQTYFSPNMGGTLTISQGSLIAQLDPAFTSITNVTGGATNTPIASYQLTSYGEDVKISSLTVTPTVTGSPSACSGLTSGQVGLENVAVYYNGSQVGSTTPATVSGTCTFNPITFNFGSSLVVGGGTTGTLQIKADLMNYAGTNYTSGNISTTVVIPIGGYQGMSSLQTNTTAYTFPTSNNLSFQSGSLTIASNPNYLAQTISPNTSGAEIGSFTLTNNSTSEGVRVNSLTVGLDCDAAGDAIGGTTCNGINTGIPAITNFSTLTLSGVTGTAPTPIGQPTSSNTFSTNFTIAPGATVTINVMSNLAGANSGSVYTTLSAQAVGATSNVAISSTATTGQGITLGVGSVGTPTLQSSASTNAQYISSGTGGASNAAEESYNFVATSGTANISQLKFAAYKVSTAASAGSLAATGSVVYTVTSTTGIANGDSVLIASSVNTNAYALGTVTAGGGGGTSLTVNVTTAGAGTAATVLDLTGTGTTTATLNSPGIATGSATFSAGVANISAITGANGSGIYVPNTPSGVTVPVFVSYAPVSSTNGVGSGTKSTIALVYVQSISGNTTTMTYPVVSGTTITLVGSKPNITLNSSGTALTTGTDILLGTVTVTADNTGDIALSQIPLTLTINGGTSGTANITSAKLTDTNDTTLANFTAASCTVAVNTTATCLESWSGGNHYRITAGTSKTFEIRATIAGAFGTSASVSAGVTPAGSFTWDDINGNGTGLFGTLLYSYPSSSVSIHN